MAWVLLVDGSPQTVPQPHPKGAHSESPRILYIYREFWKPHTQAALDRIETKGARTCLDLKCPHPYLGIESLTGSKEVWYLNGFTSTEEQKRVAEEYNNRGLFSAMNQFTQERAPYQSEPGKESFSNYRPELGHGLPWSMGQGRFLIIVLTKGNPQSDGTVFETEEGVRFIVTPAQTPSEANAKLSSAGPGAKIFAVRPHFSMRRRNGLLLTGCFGVLSQRIDSTGTVHHLPSRRTILHLAGLRRKINCQRRDARPQVN